MDDDHVWRDRIHKAVQTASSAVQELVQRNTSPFEQLAEDWPSTTGIIEFGFPNTVNHGRHSHLVAELSYSYCVDGAYYAGVCSLAARTIQEAEAICAGWKGHKVTIRYSPENKNISVMLPFATPQSV
jgi:hypothetical protein